jgi:L,D-peptidoglycan transpeptidase YkuD (ErfK/YbiS/YcfS/YnhG family)
MLTQKPLLSTPKRPCLFLKVVPAPGNRQKGRILAGLMSFPCALGRGGLGLKKREGDGVTPMGVFALRRLHIRADRVKRGHWACPARFIKKGDWWCDDVQDRAYNRLVTNRPMPRGSKEGLWREDPLYDLII